MTRHRTETPTSTQEASQRRERLRRHPVVRSVRTAARWVGFWAAVGLPTVYLPLLATGLETPADEAVFGALLVANVAGLVIGHEHNA